ncbi:MAG: TIGR04211 family SH3 domain-containing protein [Thiotrichales bacterium]|jgi:SH3 domain protein|nr:TIGR04211 family SH3 domain-containing protein [Thiotrichales bacterium]MBT3612778.1 TIGR04211 family SH3 domain-containing protein [Thiotrichales bacterium]MBT3753154.1 TIGR04211 family SH3 domain-containing protein [Thiotrichales bacterium]MBT3838196.1 TIGR04211 family SH3 domain-containing protein [Thiotrichales bacterium]MBT4151853.1 TIGR04211 family SH3 domain-containing protein [Thiotrichales bacterium]
MRTILLLIGLNIITGLAISAETDVSSKYISGVPIPLRDKPDPKNSKIVQLLKVGETVTLTEKSEGMFSYITTKSNLSGWIPKRYLTSTSPFPEAISAPEDNSGNRALDIKGALELERVKGENSAMQQEMRVLNAKIRDLIESSRLSVKEIEAIREISKDALKNKERDTKLQNKIRAQDRELKTLTQENIALQDRKDRDWFMSGSFVVIISLLTGFYLSKRGSGRSNRTTHTRV